MGPTAIQNPTPIPITSSSRSGSGTRRANRGVNASDGGSAVGHIIRWLMNGDHMLAIRKYVAYMVGRVDGVTVLGYLST